MRSKSLLLLTLAALSACAPQRPATSTPRAPDRSWAFETSDVPAEPGYRFGRLANGLRYVIRNNATPKGTALVRLKIAAGSLDESDTEQGFAHFVEHMAFNGSRNVPEGEMVRLLERKGLAFGADTNASTNFEQTLYSLDLPEATPDLLETALMLMRETASELSFSPEAVARERGVVLSELRDRNSFAWRNFVDAAAFAHPNARYRKRMPIGTPETLNAASAEMLRAFWAREYVPAQTTVIVIGDFPVDAVEAAIRLRFENWQAAPAEAQPEAGPVETERKALTDIHIDPALSEQVTVVRHGPWLDEPDTLNQRRERILRLIGYAIVNRRLQRRMLETDPPYRSAALGTSEVFEAGRSSTLLVNTVDGKWRRGLTEAAIEYRRAMLFGFNAEEIAEQVAQLRTSARNAAASADTRSNGTLLGAVLALLDDRIVPDAPANSLARLEAFVPAITPKAVHSALKREAVPLEEPLLRFQGRRSPSGGATALRAAWDAAVRTKLKPTADRTVAAFGYTDFGTPGTVASDTREPALGIRQIRFANGVMLNLKRTELQRERIAVRMNLDGGNMLQTRTEPHAVMLASMLPVGGLGKHTYDELQSVLAGRTVANALTSRDETFVSAATTTRQDLELQLQLMAATITDPGYRPTGEILFRQAMNNMFASLRATPGSSLNADLGRILSDGDPRFSLGKVEDYRALTFVKLRNALADRLAKGAIELALVGDFDEDEAIAMVARTFGALPQREAVFAGYADQRSRSFTADHSRRVLRHNGPKDQALLRLTWPTADGEDAMRSLSLQLLERVTQIEITDNLRERLGKAYSPGVSNESSRVWRSYGTFAITTSVDVAEVDATRTAIAETIAALRNAPVSDDVLQRARAPMLEDLANRLKDNAGWMIYVEHAQSKPDRIERFQRASERLRALEASDLQALAMQYLQDGAVVEVLVLPNGITPGSNAN